MRDEPEDDFGTRTSQTEIKLSPAGGPQSAVLTILTGLSAGQIFSLDEGDLVVGRAPECGMRLDDPGISRRHCVFRETSAGAFYVEDLGSTNGTYVNGKPVKGAGIHVGDRIQVGAEVVLRFALTDETEEALAKRLYESSTRDALTGAYTRKYFEERLGAEIAYSKRHVSAMGVVLFDLDRFKAVNDAYGHAAGDAVLRSVADRVRRLIRTEDIFARYGGEEFVILVRGIKAKNVVQFAERVRKSVGNAEVDFKGERLKVTVSLGVAMLDEAPRKKGPELLALADHRLYRAKTLGRNRVVAE